MSEPEQDIPLRRRLVYVGLLFGVGLLLLEGGMRLVFHLRGDLPPTPDASLVYEWKWAQARLASGAPREASRGLVTFDPDLGWRLSASYDEDGTRSNAQGLRADREYPPGPQPGRRRLALLGDSFTFGDHVANDETFAHYLETQELDGWDVLNFGVNGYGTDQALLAYELRGGGFAADIVVMGFYVGDYERNVQRFKVYAKPVFEIGPRGLELTHHPVPEPEQLFEEYASGRREIGALRGSYLVGSIARALQRLRERRPAASDPEWKVLAGLMRRFRDHVRDQGAAPVWLVLPYRDVVSEPRSRHAAIEELCEREARALGLPLLRMDAAFREHAARQPQIPLYRPREIGGHFTAAGHRLVARSLAAFLAAEGLLEATAP